MLFVLHEYSVIVWLYDTITIKFSCAFLVVRKLDNFPTVFMYSVHLYLLYSYKRQYFGPNTCKFSKNTESISCVDKH